MYVVLVSRSCSNYNKELSLKMHLHDRLLKLDFTANQSRVSCSFIYCSVVRLAGSVIQPAAGRVNVLSKQMRSCLYICAYMSQSGRRIGTN